MSRLKSLKNNQEDYQTLLNLINKYDLDLIIQEELYKLITPHGTLTGAEISIWRDACYTFCNNLLRLIREKKEDKLSNKDFLKEKKDMLRKAKGIEIGLGKQNGK